MTTIVRMLAVTALMLAASLAQAQNKVPSERALEALVKTTLLTFNDANVTGNYEVFHAKLSKPFREQFPVERLARRFQEFNKKHVDFDIVAALKPSYDPAPKVDDDGKLQVKGYFPTEPLQVYFNLEFIPSDGEWKLIAINVKIGDPK
ncbi:MAG TPA: hypothetical protein VD858_11730 [Reyranella sp.]|nr:hypothetical protein [Reyranella sp.]